jgi:hypothetical protein
MPPPRPPGYPLDVTQRYTTAGRNQLGKSIGPVGPSAGIIHDADGDIKDYVVFQAARSAWRETYTALAYLDLIDQNVLSAADQLNELGQKQETLAQAVQQLSSRIDQVGLNLERLMNFMGSVVPAWQTKEEVENGDDMGLVTMSAAQLGLNVVYESVRQAAGFQHEDVVSISPSAGTLVQRGSTVTVVLNLEG